MSRQIDFIRSNPKKIPYFQPVNVSAHVVSPMPGGLISQSDDQGHEMLTIEQMHQLLGAIYQGCMEPLPWSTALTILCGTLSANWATLILRPASDTRQALIVNSGPNGAFMETGKFATYSAFMLNPFSNLPPDRVVSVDDVVGTKHWVNSEFYRQFLEPADIRHMIGADVLMPDGSDCQLRICRPPSAAPFSEGDKALCESLLPHVKQAVQLHSRLERIESERTVYATTIDRMLLGAVVFDEFGKIIRVNRPAEEIISKNDGLRLCAGHLEASYTRENTKLQGLIRRALADTTNSISAIEQAMSITRPSGRTKLGIAVRANPVGELSEGIRRATVTVFIRDPEQKSIAASRDIIQQLFEFTPCETSVAILLADGLNLDEAADKLNIRKNTARAHLRSIFSKTGIKRQTSLVRLLHGSVS